MTPKDELIGQLENARNNYILGLAAISLFSEPFSVEKLQKSYTRFGKYCVPFNQVATLLMADADREMALKEFSTMLLRALLKESFEVVKDYAKKTKQEKIFKSQSWYVFSYMIRNCISHNFRFSFLPRDFKRLPVTWSGITIDRTLDKKPLTLKFFGFDAAWDLFCEVERFATKSLA
jgi:hypothetical protein